MAIVTSIDVVVGGSPVHVTVDAQNGQALPPANIAWTGAGLTFTADDTGFMVAADAGTAPGAVEAVATYTGPLASAAVSGTLAVNVLEGVTAIEFSSP
jgi:hypothetical protein